MTASPTPWSISGKKEANAPLEASVRGFLQDLTTDHERHAVFMNMLSMLEHLGSRKIMISQMDKCLTEDILKHLAEEARHAYFFKRQAERLAKRSLDGYEESNTMCRVPALMYFGRLDAGISSRVAEDPYPWVSLVIELRACWLYAIYQEILAGSDLHISLKSLLAEEDMHLAEMFEMCGENHDQLRSLSQYEDGLFAKLWTTLCAESQGQPKARQAA